MSDKGIGVLIGIFVAYWLWTHDSSSSNSSSSDTPDSIAQDIRNENADFWRSVGSPFDVSNGQIVATPPFIDGFSQVPFNASDVSIGGGFVT